MQTLNKNSGGKESASLSLHEHWGRAWMAGLSRGYLRRNRLGEGKDLSDLHTAFAFRGNGVAPFGLLLLRTPKRERGRMPKRGRRGRWASSPLLGFTEPPADVGCSHGLLVYRNSERESCIGILVTKSGGVKHENKDGWRNAETRKRHGEQNRRTNGPLINSSANDSGESTINTCSGFLK